MGMKLCDTRGQMTVEFVTIIPVFLIIAVIAVNALLFFGDCAAFDRVARDAVRITATSPAYGQTVDQSCAHVEGLLDERFVRDNLSTHVEVAGGQGGHIAYTATLEFSPTLFGLGIRSEVLGVPLPRLKHSVSLTVDTYKPGVLL